MKIPKREEERTQQHESINTESTARSVCIHTSIYSIDGYIYIYTYCKRRELLCSNRIAQIWHRKQPCADVGIRQIQHFIVWMLLQWCLNVATQHTQSGKLSFFFLSLLLLFLYKSSTINSTEQYSVAREERLPVSIHTNPYGYNIQYDMIAYSVSC